MKNTETTKLLSIKAYILDTKIFHSFTPVQSSANCFGLFFHFTPTHENVWM